MDVHFRLGIILIAAIIIVLLLIDAWFSERRSRMAVKSSDYEREDVEHHFNRLYDRPSQTVSVDSKKSPHSLDYFFQDIDSPSKKSETTMLKSHPVRDLKAQNKKAGESNKANDLLVLHVIAKQGSLFSSYNLLQAITATGMQYGAMNIFHYYEETKTDTKTLFSLASATEPGEFDLNHIGDFACAGLTLFMNMAEVPYPMDAFEMMLDTAVQLADDLEGEVYAAPSVLWSDAMKEQYQERISVYQDYTARNSQCEVLA